MKKSGLIITLLLSILLILPAVGCKTVSGDFNTRVSVVGDKWYFNDQVINPGSPAEGLLMNVRMVNAVFEDRGEELEKLLPAFDPDENTDAFIRRIPEYVEKGLERWILLLSELLI